MAIRDYEPQLAVVPPIKAKVLAVASENRDLRDQVGVAGGRECRWERWEYQGGRDEEGEGERMRLKERGGKG